MAAISRFTNVNGLMIPGHTPPSHKGGRIERVEHLDRQGRSALCGMRRRKAAGAERSRVRRDRRLLVHRSRQQQREAPHAWRALLREGRRIEDHKGAARVDCRPTASASRPTARRCITPKRCPGRLWSLPLTAPGVGSAGRGFTPANFEGAYPGLAYFDSLGVQADGGVCVATILAGGISTFWPDRQEIRAHAAARSARHEYLLGRQGHEDGVRHDVVDGKARRDGMALAGTAGWLITRELFASVAHSSKSREEIMRAILFSARPLRSCLPCHRFCGRRRHGVASTATRRSRRARSGSEMQMLLQRRSYLQRNGRVGQTWCNGTWKVDDSKLCRNYNPPLPMGTVPIRPACRSRRTRSATPGPSMDRTDHAGAGHPVAHIAKINC